MATHEQLRRDLAGALEGHAVPVSDLQAMLRVRGLRVSQDDIDRLLQFDTSFAELSSGVVYIPDIVDGMAFALPVDQADMEALPIFPWLEPIGWWLIEDNPVLLDETGRELGVITTEGRFIDDRDTDVVCGPEGWLDHAVDGWITLRVRSGDVIVESGGRGLTADPGRAGALAAAFAAIAEHQTYTPLGADEPIEIARAQLDDLALEAMVADRAAFVGEALVLDTDQLALAGLRMSHHRDVVSGDVGLDLVDEADQHRFAETRYGVDADTVRSVQAVLGAVSLFADEDPETFGATAEEQVNGRLAIALLLENPSVAIGVVHECRGRQWHGLALEFAESLDEVTADVSDVWGPTWFRAHCHLALGEVDLGAALLDQVSTTVDHIPLIIDRAAVEATRSNARPAIALIERSAELSAQLPTGTLAGYEFDRDIGELFEEVEVWAMHAPPARAGRNDQCPCGSGRKYKRCHLGRELHPLADRSAWLADKLRRYARSTAPADLDALQDEFDLGAGRDEMPWRRPESLLIEDLALFEGGIAERFLENCNLTLPDDEVLLTQQWLLVNRSVFEVERDRADSLLVRDLATGDKVTVSNVDRDQPLSRGALLLGRPLPVGDTYRSFFGFSGLAPHLVTDLLGLIDDGDPDELAHFLGAMQRPPVIQNTDGHDMVVTDLTWTVPSDADVEAALEAAGFMSDGARWTLNRRTKNHMDAVVATVSFDDEDLYGEVNSAERADELIALIAEHLPAAELVDREVVDLEDLDLSAGDGGDMLAPLDDPEIRAAIEAHMANYEEEWLDLPVPALGNRTPREAATDPIGREELIRLLASFPEPEDAAVGMSPTRLRQALDL